MTSFSSGRGRPDANSWLSGDGVRHLALVTFSLLCAALWAARAREVGPRFAFLWWNLFLAWVPWGLAVALKRTNGTLFWLTLTAWLAFFPNAPYLVTDLVHLKPREGVPLWFDVLLLSSFAWAGCALGWSSLEKVHLALSERHGEGVARLMVLGSILLCGVGVFLGRFERLNSWELLTDPLQVAATIATSIFRTRALLFSGAFAIFVGAGYLFVRPRPLSAS